MKDIFERFDFFQTFRLLLNAELVSAQDFEYDGLFIHYFVELPLGWSATKESQLWGITQRFENTLLMLKFSNP